MPGGAIKLASQWKKTWEDVRLRVVKRVGEHFSRNKSNPNARASLILRSYDKKILKIAGMLAVVRGSSKSQIEFNEMLENSEIFEIKNEDLFDDCGNMTEAYRNFVANDKCTIIKTEYNSSGADDEDISDNYYEKYQNYIDESLDNSDNNDSTSRYEDDGQQQIMPMVVLGADSVEANNLSSQPTTSRTAAGHTPEVPPKKRKLEHNDDNFETDIPASMLDADWNKRKYEQFERYLALKQREIDLQEQDLSIKKAKKLLKEKEIELSMENSKAVKSSTDQLSVISNYKDIISNYVDVINNYKSIINNLTNSKQNV